MRRLCTWHLAVPCSPTPAAVAGRALLALATSASGLLGLAIIAFWLLAAIFGPALLSHDAAAMGGGEVFAPISAAHWLGTDYLGRDMLARVIEGARYTVGVAFVADAARQRHRHGAGSAGRGQRAAGSTPRSAARWTR